MPIPKTAPPLNLARIINVLFKQAGVRGTYDVTNCAKGYIFVFESAREAAALDAAAILEGYKTIRTISNDRRLVIYEG